MVKLSVCIPSRNRQKYCIETIQSLAKSDNQDIEFIVGDNSDDPKPLAEFFKTFDDKRFKFVPSGERVYSMVENWNRLIPFTSGEWVSFIGDDDYIDPDLTKLISGIQETAPNADALSWVSMSYVWPEIRPKNAKISIPVETGVYLQSQEEMLRRTFYWHGATDRILCNYGIYHCALKRDLLETIKDTFGGMYFKHQIVDYECICKTILVAKQLVLSLRPMSVMGACAASNTAALIDPKLVKSRVDTFHNEVKNSDQGHFRPKGFPFPDDLGLTAVIGSTILWVIQEYGLEVVGWEKNFVKACQNSCENAITHEEFKKMRRGYAKAIRSWKGGRYLKHFNPQFIKENVEGIIHQGVYKEKIYVNSDLEGVRTPAEAFEALKCMLPSVEFILEQLDPAKKAA